MCEERIYSESDILKAAILVFRRIEASHADLFGGEIITATDALNDFLDELGLDMHGISGKS